jgi:hypothetical protein
MRNSKEWGSVAKAWDKVSGEFHCSFDAAKKAVTRARKRPVAT